MNLFNYQIMKLSNHQIIYCLITFLTLFNIPSKLSAITKEPEPIEADEVLVVLYVKNLGTCEIPAAIRGQEIYLPVVDVFNFLKIRTIPSTGFDNVSGFFIDPQSTYLIDRINNIIIYKGKTYPLDPSDIIVTETNLYLKVKYFDRIFGLECRFNYRTLTISLKSATELPAVREMRLEQMHANLDRLKGEIKADTTIARTYPLLHFGMADWAINSNQQVNGPTNTQLNLGLGAILGGGELNSLLNYHSNQPLIEKQQYYLWRYADNGNPNIKQFLVGKIATQAISSILFPVVGAQITNAPTINRKSFGTYTLSNYTQPNWTVELYVNGVLIDYAKADASGFFTFNVPLIYGSTDVTLRYYGPWGEELSSRQSFNIPFNFLPPKEMEYKISSGVIENDKNSLFGQARLNYGLTKAITVGGGLEYNSSIVTSKNIAFINTSIRLASNMLFSGEYDYGIRYKGLLSYHLPSNLQLELYYSKYNPSQQAILLNYTEERRATISEPFHFLSISGLSRFTLSQNLVQQPNSETPITKYTIPEFALSGGVHGVSVNLTTSAFILSNINTSVYTDASLSAVLPGGIIFTPKVRYDYKLNQITIVNYSLEQRFRKYGVINASYQNNLTYNSPVYQIGFRYDFVHARVGTSVLQSNNINSFTEFASGSLIYQPQLNYYDLNVNANVGRGGLIFVPFLDINNNGKRDANEPKVSGLNILVNGGGIQKRNKDTTIVITGLEPYTNYFVELDANNFENISWKIIKPKMSIAIEPNKLKVIEIPISILGEASGTVYIKKNNEETGLGRITVCFYNKDSILVNKTLSESDGYFSFLGLLPDTYYAKIDGTQLNKLHLTSSPSLIPFTIKSNINGDVVDGMKFILQPKKNGSEEITSQPIPDSLKTLLTLLGKQHRNDSLRLANIEPKTNPENTLQVSDALNKALALMIKHREDSLRLANIQPNTNVINQPQVSDSLSKALALMVKHREDSLRLANIQPNTNVIQPQVSDSLNKVLAMIVKHKEDSLRLANIQPNTNVVNPPQVSDSLTNVTAFNLKHKEDSLKSVNKQVETDIAKNSETSNQNNYVVQVGANSQESEAKIMQAKLNKTFKDQVTIVHEGGLYKVRITGLSSRDEALVVLSKIRDKGFKDAYIKTLNPGAELTGLLYKQLVKKAEALLDNPKSSPEAMQDLRNEISSFSNTEFPNVVMQNKLQEYSERLNKPKVSPNVIIKGTVSIESGDSKGDYSEVKITVTDKVAKQTFTIKPSSKTGKYILILSRRKQYSITIANKGYQTYSEDFSPTDDDEYEITKKIELKE